MGVVNDEGLVKVLADAVMEERSEMVAQAGWWVGGIAMMLELGVASTLSSDDVDRRRNSVRELRLPPATAMVPKPKFVEDHLVDTGIGAGAAP
ncbi:hypothetical protein PIB30_103240 [Stylosanthes scabra]|uniref:Uncharacterized protein n=1 Tax=Stylosanthes scabra TaxID=79078 RepID=A0ABU6QXD7_9FABA|nr:hypothetical protein [Stylosanthes scabra]